MDYDAARAAGLISAADEPTGFDPADEANLLAWQDLAVGRGLTLPWILEIQWTMLRESTLGVADVRCAVSWAPERTSILRLSDTAEFDEATLEFGEVARFGRRRRAHRRPDAVAAGDDRRR